MNTREVIVHDLKKIQHIQDYYSAFGNMAQLKLCQRFFSKEENKNFEACVAILKFMIEKHSVNEFDRSVLLEIDAPIFRDANERTPKGTKYKEVLLRDGLKILRCHKLVHFDGEKYKINRDLWSKYVSYGIRDKQLLSELAPALLRHIRNDIRKNPNDFFIMTSKVIGFALRESASFNNEYEQTYHVFWQIEKGGFVSLELEKDIFEDVIPLGIVIGENEEKMFEYRFKDDKETHTVPLNKIVIAEEGIE
jgi:hypothetical protein